MKDIDLIVTMTIIAISSLYIANIAAAVLSYWKYRFSPLLFIPIVLLLPASYFIFPIFAYAEYRKIRERTTDFRTQRLLRLKRNISWIPAISSFVIYKYLDIAFSFEVEAVSLDMVNLACTHGVVLIITIFVLWLRTRLTKIANDVL